MVTSAKHIGTKKCSPVYLIHSRRFVWQQFFCKCQAVVLRRMTNRKCQQASEIQTCFDFYSLLVERLKTELRRRADVSYKHSISVARLQS